MAKTIKLKPAPAPRKPAPAPRKPAPATSKPVRTTRLSDINLPDNRTNDFEVAIHGLIFLQGGAETDTPVRAEGLTVEGAATPDSADRIVSVKLEYAGPGAPAAAGQTSAVAAGGWVVTFAPPGVATVTGGTVTATIAAFGVTASTVRRFTYGLR